MIDGSLSNFTLIGRDAFPNPSTSTSSLDADFLNLPEHALLRLEEYNVATILLDAENARTPAFAPVVQRWMLAYEYPDPALYSFQVQCPISPVFLEDAGLIVIQDLVPDNAQVSLAQAVSYDYPQYVASGDTLGNTNAFRVPHPSWMDRLRTAPLVKTAVRYLGATTTQAVGLENVRFFDAGDGISPRMTGTVRFTTPDQRDNTLPTGYYEIFLVVGAWIP